MKKLFIILFVFGSINQFSVFAQMNKYDVKKLGLKYLLENTFKIEGKDILPFQLNILTSSSKNEELVLLHYSVKEKNIEGVLLCFSNPKWKPGAIFTQYSFYDLNIEKAHNFINTLIKVEKNWKKNVWGENSLSFKFEDLSIVMPQAELWGGSSNMSIFWNDFQSEWSYFQLQKVKSRLDKFIKKSKN